MNKNCCPCGASGRLARIHKGLCWRCRIEDRIAAGVRTITGCWQIPGRHRRDGYPSFNRAGNPDARVSRYVLERKLGYEPTVCRHTCDNPRCVEPSHLLDGTHADNTRDKIDRGRARYDVQRKYPPCAYAEVKQLRGMGFSYRAISERTGLSTSYCCDIVKGRRPRSTRMSSGIAA